MNKLNKRCCKNCNSLQKLDSGVLLCKSKPDQAKIILQTYYDNEIIMACDFCREGFKEYTDSQNNYGSKVLSGKK